MECQNIIIFYKHKLLFPLIASLNTLNIDQDNLRKLLTPQKCCFSLFFEPQTRLPKKSQNFDTIFLFPMKKNIRRKKMGINHLVIFGFSKINFLADFGIFLLFFYIKTGYTVPSLLDMPLLEPIHQIYVCYLQYSSSFQSFFTPKISKTTNIVFFELL